MDSNKLKTLHIALEAKMTETKRESRAYTNWELRPQADIRGMLDALKETRMIS